MGVGAILCGKQRPLMEPWGGFFIYIYIYIMSQILVGDLGALLRSATGVIL